MNKLSMSLVAGTLAITSQYANAITIEFNYDFDGGFFSGVNHSSRREVLKAAGALFENRLTDNLSAITSSGTNHFNTVFTRPDNGSGQDINDFSVEADTLVVYVGGRALTGSTIGRGGPGGFTVRGSQAFVDDTVTRGQGPATADFGPWGGAMTFNSNSAWYFDEDVSTVETFSGQNDFYSVAIHELGHILGYGTSTTWNNLHADAHWANGTTSLVNGVSQEAAMDPSIFVGTRKYFTDLDFQGLRDIGWQVTAVPVTGAVYLFASALIGLMGFRRKL